MLNFLKGSWAIKVGGILIIAIVGWIVERLLNSWSDAVAKMPDIDKLSWGIAIVLLLIGVFLFFSPIIEKWIQSLSGEKKKETIDPSKPTVQYVAHVEWLKKENTLLKQQIAEMRKQTSTNNENKINTNAIPFSAEAITNSLHVLAELIQEGEQLVSAMRRPDFHVGQLGQDVRLWLDNVNHSIWDALPRDYASYITANQGDITESERLVYHGWNRGAAYLRISVERRLARLREIKSKLSV